MTVTPTPALPTDAQLLLGLREVFANDATGRHLVRLIGRRRLVVASTFPAEVVTCQLSNGQEPRLFCKYASGSERPARGPRGGVAYEAALYRDLLSLLDVTVPDYFGSYTAPESNDCWLILEFLEHACHVNQGLGPAQMSRAAGWLGHFQATLATSHSALPPYIFRYDRTYFGAWAERAARFAVPLRHEMPWFDVLCTRFAAAVETLHLTAPTLIHGEFYPLNVLVHDGAIYPVDWESAALAAGEIDLASLTERWSSAVARQCEEAYVAARWPEGAPREFGLRLAAARLYLQLRWLGDRPEWTLHDTLRPRFDQARLLGQQLGLL